MLRAAVLFLAVYAVLALVKKERWRTVWAGIAAGLALGVIEPPDLVLGVNWNVIGIFAGSLIVAELFVYSRMPEAISDELINRSPDLRTALLLVIGFASIFSIFMDNVVTVLIVAPIALQLTRKSGVSPVPVIIGLAVASNLQGMAILIGDTPSMLLAAWQKMSFLDFFWHEGRPGIFWFVQLGAVTGMVVLWMFIRKDRQRRPGIEVTSVRSRVPLALIVLMVVLLSLMTLVDPGFRWFGGVVCVVVGLGGMAWYAAARRGGGERHEWYFDWRSLLFLCGIFILVRMLENAGVVDNVVDRLGGLRGRHPFVVLSIIVWFSVLISAFIDNIPFIAAMLPLVRGLGISLGMDEMLLALGLLIGSCMGGNITPVGAAANLAAVGILEKEGRQVSFARFVQVGLPFTVAATTVAYTALYLFYR